MLILLSPAKDLSTLAPPTTKGATQPALLEHAPPLVEKLRTLTAKKVGALMDLSPKLAELNRQRYASWSLPFTVKNAVPAAFLFNGEVYRGLEARTLDADDLRFAQYHLRILSGLYGVLRPMDLIQPYRLMMGTKFGVGRAKDLYAYWGDRINAQLKADLKAAGDDTVLDLASTEYAKAAKLDAIGARVITPVFKDKGPGGYAVRMAYAKYQRGAMARHIVQHRILDAAKLKKYTEDGYRFSAEDSTAEEWVFLRDTKPDLAARAAKRAAAARA